MPSILELVMGKSQYKIQFGGLSFGEHQFEFEVNEKFFEQFSESEITEADIQVKANLVKQNTLMHIQNGLLLKYYKVNMKMLLILTKLQLKLIQIMQAII